MRRRFVVSALMGAVVLGFAPASGQPAPTTIEVVLTEGTNMAAALSPDGTTLAVDLIGRIWILPAVGGEARPITDPFGDARAPTWSPDGRRVAFQAYWSGDYDIWVVNADGSGLMPLTRGPFDDREPHWSPDGSRVAFSSDRGETYDIWDVDPSTGSVRQLTDGAENEYNPAFAPDSRQFAYVSDGSQSGVWTRSGTAAPTRVADLEGGQGFAPSWSPEGTRIAYNRLADGASELYVAQADGSAGLGSRVSLQNEDVFPFRATWRDGSTLLYTADGKIRTRPAGGGRATDVAFTATVPLDRPAYRRALRSLDPEGARPVRGMVSPTLSPDGTEVAFTALGDLWTMEIGAPPVRLTDDPWVEVDAAWSPDGTALAFASDRAGRGLDLWIRDVASGSERRLTLDGGSGPRWSPDGREIAYSGGQGPEAGLRVLNVATGESRSVRTGLNNPGRPTWSPDGRSIAVSALWTYSSRFREGVNRPLLLPVSRPISEQQSPATDSGSGLTTGRPVPPGHGWSGAIDPAPEVVLQTGERWLDFTPHASMGTRGSDGPLWSPDGRTLAYVSSGVLWTVHVSPDGTPLGPPARLNNELTSDPSWAGDSRSILYLSTSHLRRVWLDDGRIDDLAVPLTYERSVPAGRFVVHAGALFDGTAERLRRDVDIVVDGHRIVRVVGHDAALHGGRVVDASEGVVMPGLIEMHAHGGTSAGEAAGRQWLSYGVTTVRTPAADPYETNEEREAYATFRRIGPRLFGTGYTIDGSRIYYGGAPSLTSSGQVELSLGEAADLEFDVIKTYVRLPDAVQRRVIEEAHALGLPVTSHELYPGVAYGADGVEHVRGTSRRGYSTKVTQLNRSYQDVVELLAQSRMAITPTVGIYGGHQLVGEEDPTLFDDPRSAVFFPERGPARPRGGDLATRRRMVSDMASLGRRVHERGGVVIMGTDAPINPHGLSLLAEMQALVRYGGMRPVDVLRGATSLAADVLGYGAELGTVRPGMLADLVILGADPLTDIRALRDVRTVIRDGRVFTLSELLTRPLP